MIELTVLDDNQVELNTLDDGWIGLDVVMPTGGGGTATLQTKSVSYTPTESQQTATVTADAGYDGLSEVDVTVGAIDSNYVGSNVPRRGASDVVIGTGNVMVKGGYYAGSGNPPVVSKLIPLGTMDDPVATKGEVDNHTISITPSVRISDSGWFSNRKHTGTAVTVSASELVSGTKNITANGTEDVTNYASVSVAVPQPSGTKNITISANGTTTEDVTSYASASITANVPNTYSASDGGKVVDNGALVSQTSQTITENGTYDTTLIDDVIVNVSGGGGGDWKFAKGTITPTQRYDTAVQVTITDTETIGFTPTIFLLVLSNKATVANIQYAMLASIFLTNSIGNQYRMSLRYSSTTNTLNGNVFNANAWTSSSASLLNLSSGNIRFYASAGYNVMDKEYTWYAFAPTT